MLVKLDRQTYDMLDNVSFIWACMEPTIRRLPLDYRAAIVADVSDNIRPYSQWSYGVLLSSILLAF